jgi:hypothetical protein
MSDLYERLRTWGKGEIDGGKAIRVVNRIWAIGDEEGYTSQRGRLAADAVIIAVAHSEYVPPPGLQLSRTGATKHIYSAEAAVEWAQLALRWASYELGTDSDLAEEMRIAMQRPKEHVTWGQRLTMSIDKPWRSMFEA